MKKITTKRVNIFDGEDISVFSISSDEPEEAELITFGSWLSEPYQDRPTNQLKGFGQGLFVQNGIKEIHIIPRKNHWYQSSEMNKVLKLITLQLKTNNRWTCGGSMGGYAAINFSEKLNSKFISFCPQFSADSRVVPFESRWLHDRATIAFQYDYLWHYIRQTGFVFFDPYSLDLKHALLIKDNSNAILVNCPFAGHNVLKYVQEVYGLFNIVKHIICNGSIPKNFFSEQRKNKRTSKVYLTNLHNQCIKRKGTRQNQYLYLKFAENIFNRIKKLDK